MELKYEPIGKIKMTKARRWELKAERMSRMLGVVSFITFVLGICTGLFLGTF